LFLFLVYLDFDWVEGRMMVRLGLLILEVLCCASFVICLSPDEQADVLAEIFVSLGYTKNATILNASNVCGSFPGIIVRCGPDQNISVLNLTGISLKGTLPCCVCKLTHLTLFSLRTNFITGTIPPEYSNLSSLAYFDIAENNISGTIPASLSSLKQLHVMYLNRNNLSGSISSSFYNLALIENFDVSDNKLCGTLPPELGNWTNVLQFSVDTNQLQGSLPATYQSFAKATFFNVGSNLLTGSLPPEYFKMAAMIKFRAENNTFTGTLPANFSAWKNLTSFTVASNQISGTLPPGYRNWTIIQDFRTQNNQINGTLPPEYGDWKLIEHFSVRNNNHTGTLPDIYAVWRSIEYFNVANNRITGTLPSLYSSWGMSIVRILTSYNSLIGSIPPSWPNEMKALHTLSASNNSLSGTFPKFRQALRILTVGHNNFSGTLPDTLTALILLDAQNNNLLDGPIPRSNGPLYGVSACNTQLCTNSSYPVPFIFWCFPVEVSVSQLDDLDPDSPSDVSAVYLFLSNYRDSLSTCSETPVTPESPGPQNVINTTTNEGTNVPVAVAAVVMTGAVIFSAISGVDASDAQMLASILGSPCTCRDGLQSASSSTLTTLLSLSFFAPLGAQWSVVGNVVLCVTFIAAHAIAVKTFPESVATDDGDAAQTSSSLSPSQLPISSNHPPELKWWRRKRHDNGRDLGKLSRLRFPNLSIVVVFLLVPGIARGISDVSQNIDDENDIGSFGIVAIVVGAASVFYAAWCMEKIVYRHINKELEGEADFHKQKAKRSARAFRYSLYQQISKVFAPVPRRVSLIALPRGSWVPEVARKSYGGLVSNFVERWRRAWLVLPFCNVALQFLSGIKKQCDVTQGLTLCLLMGTCVFFAAVRPHRALLSSYLACISIALTFVVALLALLCRLDPDNIDSSAVSNVGGVVSFFIMLCKAYNIALPFVETWLLQKNEVITYLAAAIATDRHQQLLENTDVGQAAISPRSLQKRSPSRLGHAINAHNKSQYREIILQELIELVCSAHQPPKRISRLSRVKRK
jgi:Leucine-rich repeat (LRR) protein